MNNLETLTYETKAMLEVVSDGMLNECAPSDPEDSAVILRMAGEKIEKMREIHEEMWDEQREAMAQEAVTNDDDDDGDNEDANGDENFDTKDVFSDLSDAVNKWESQKAKEDEEPTRSFNVKELKRNEDGSATYEVSGSDEKMQELFEVFFTYALINGIKYTLEDNQKEIHKMHAITAARELEVLLREWETSDDLDYAPVVKNKRLKLKELLDKAGT
jgi:hypothetical protein